MNLGFGSEIFKSVYGKSIPLNPKGWNAILCVCKKVLLDAVEYYEQPKGKKVTLCSYYVYKSDDFDVDKLFFKPIFEDLERKGILKIFKAEHAKSVLDDSLQDPSVIIISIAFLSETKARKHLDHITRSLNKESICYDGFKLYLEGDESRCIKKISKKSFIGYILDQYSPHLIFAGFFKVDVSAVDNYCSRYRSLLTNWGKSFSLSRDTLKDIIKRNGRYICINLERFKIKF